ncbi:MAG: hypothetical protein ACOVN7_08055, partial [Rubrivivax sp.]
IIPCTLCGSQDNLQRVQVKKMIHEWERQYPGRIDNMFSAMGHVVPSHMMDRKLYPFQTLQATGVADPQGDRAFDEDEDETCAPAAAGAQTIRMDAIGRAGGAAEAHERSNPWSQEQSPEP